MKCIHLSDLHIGKRVNEFSMIEDQSYILTQILNIVDDEKPESLFICGDVYDKTVPSAEAVSLFDDFLVRLSRRNLKIFVISGNHDSPERIAFGGKLMDARGVYMSPVYSKGIEPIVLTDAFGPIAIYMLPFIKPAHVRAIYPDETIENYTDAMAKVITEMQVDQSIRNVLLTHQFVTGSERSDSEEISVGGTDNVSAQVFQPFDYVALGHLHKPQSVFKETIRYCGTPLKYSFSESSHVKSVTVVELHEKGNTQIRTVPLKPKRDLVELKGTYMDLTAKSFYEGLNLDDYYRITLTDENDVPEVLNKLRVIYRNIMRLDYDNKRTRENTKIDSMGEIEKKTPFTLVSELYEMQNNQALSEDQTSILRALIEAIWEGEK